ncbi:MAG: Tll0287-like domain-containing protein, partial [Pirellulaceae bacterium]
MPNNSARTGEGSNGLPNESGIAFVKRLLLDKTILVLAILFGVGLILLLVIHRSQQSDLIESIAVEEAERYTRALASFRTLYTRDVVSTALEQQIPVTHDFNLGANKGKAIPLPATLAKSLGKEITDDRTGSSIGLYSPYPFPLPGREGLPDSFAESAWEALKADPDQPFYRFQTLGGRDVIRYATADLMRKSCVNCHNTHAQSPK